MSLNHREKQELNHSRLINGAIDVDYYGFESYCFRTIYLDSIQVQASLTMHGS